MTNVTRCGRRYGMGSNPRGGIYIAVDGDRIWERLTISGGRYPPIDGGPNPRWDRLAAALGKWPLDASDEEIVAAWVPHEATEG